MTAATGPPRARQRAKSSRMHEIILDAVMECLDGVGYAETSISRVIERAGVSRGALQHHFPTKEDLMAAAAERLMASSLAELAAPPAAGAIAVADGLRALWRGLIDTRAYRALLEILNAMRTDTRLRRRLLPILVRWNEALDEQMVARYQSPRGGDAEVRELMTLSRCLLRGLAIQQRFMTDSACSEALLERWIDLVAPRLRARRPAGLGSSA